MRNQNIAPANLSWFIGLRLASLAFAVATGMSGCGVELDRTPPPSTGPAHHVESMPRSLSGVPVNPLESARDKILVLLFVSTDCPISNRYAPEMRRLQSQFSSRGVQFWLVYPHADETVAIIEKHRHEFSLGDFEVLRDPAHWLVRKTGATVTPEAIVFSVSGQQVYSGRIDNRYLDFGKERTEPTQRDLLEALETLVQGKPLSSSKQPAVGCYIQ